MSWQEVHRFYTHDGEWYPSNKPYSISQEDADLYAAQIKAKGAASHLCVRYIPGLKVFYFTDDGKQNVEVYCDEYGWANLGVERHSAYWPPNEGPWSVGVAGQTAVRGLGLPEGYHVSTYVVLGETVTKPDPTPPPAPIPGFAYEECVRIASYVESESGALTRCASLLLPRTSLITLEELDAQGHPTREQTVWRAS